MPDKFELECALVIRLIEELGLSGVPSDPKKTYGRETGADVEVRLASRRIGVQVTQYHGDEGQGGSALRAQEESDAAKSIVRTYAVPTDASCGLTKRFSDKLAKASRYTFEEFAEVWLLIAAFLPKLGAVAATSAAPIFITTEWREQHFGEALRASTYQRAFFHVHLWPALYEWSLERGWQVIREPEKLTPDGADGQLWFKQHLDDPELLRDPAINSTTPGDARQRGGYVLKTGKPRWSVGCIKNGPRHDAGLRWFVCERGPGGDLHAVAYTEEREEAEMIVASLEQTEGDRSARATESVANGRWWRTALAARRSASTSSLPRRRRQVREQQVHTGWPPGKVTLDPAKLSPIATAKLKSLGTVVPIPNIDFLSNPLAQPLHVINPGALPNQPKDV